MPYPSGSQAFSLQDNSTLDQSLYFLPGTYMLAWSQASRAGQVNPYWFQLNGTNVGSEYAIGNTSWTSTSATFAIYTAGTYTIGFSGTTTPPGDESVGLDDMLLSAVAPQLPALTTVNVAAGATWDLNGSTQTLGALSGAAGGLVLDSGALIIGGNGASTVFAGAISGSGSLTVAGSSASVALTGTSSYTGATTVTAGTLAFASIANADGQTPSSLGSPAAANGTIALGYANSTSGYLQFVGSASCASNRTIYLANGSTLDASGAAGAVITLTGGTAVNLNGSQLTLAGGGEGVVTGRIVDAIGSGSVVKTGSGTWILAGTNSYPGTTSVQAGVLDATTTAALPGYLSGQVSVAPEAVLAVQSTTGSIGWSSAQIDRLANEIAWSSNSLLGIDTTRGNFTYGTSIPQGQAFGIAKVGINTLTLSGANGYTGPTALLGGTLSLASSSALGNTDAIVFFGGSLQYTSSNTNDYSSLIQDSIGPVSIDTNGHAVTFASPIDASNTGGLLKTGAGTLSLAAANGYGGSTTIQAGVLNFSNGGLSSGGVTFTGGTLQYAAGNGQDVSSQIVNSTAAMAVDTNGQSVTFNTPLAASNVGGLTKLGSGTLAISGGGHGYGGPTRILAGTLQLGGYSASSPVAHYSFDGNTNDSSGNGNNGTLTGATYTAGPSGQAISFNGNQSVAVPNSSSLQLSGDFTVSAWFNLDAAGLASNVNGILGTRFGQDQTFDVKVDGLDGKIHGDVGTGSNWINTGLDINNLSINPGQWYMVTYVITPTGAQLYFDGVDEQNFTWATTTPTFMTPAAGGRCRSAKVPRTNT